MWTHRCTPGVLVFWLEGNDTGNCITFVLRKVREQKFCKYDDQLPLGVGLVLVNIQSNELRGDNKQKRHFFERLSVTLQWENGTMLLKRCPLPTADVDGEL